MEWIKFERIIEGEICYISGFVKHFGKNGYRVIDPREEFPIIYYRYVFSFLDSDGKTHREQFKTYEDIDIEPGLVAHLWIKKISTTMVEIVDFDITDPSIIEESWPEGITPTDFQTSTNEEF